IPCVSSSNVWITNFTATPLSKGAATVTFGIAGGWEGLNGPFDVFANAVLGPTNVSANQWVWVGQGYSCTNYQLTLSNSAFTAFFILGTPQRTLDDGLTDAYRLLVCQGNVTNAYSAGDGIPDAWKALWGVAPRGNVANLDPDKDALLNWQEYSWGTGPYHNDGLAPWIACPSTPSGIP
ncbi:MAG: hypothetical protein ACREIC_22280, partial [Limisphaerales bacterium]